MKVHGLVKWYGYIGLVSEYVSCGSLAGFTSKPVEFFLPPKLALRMAFEIASGIENLYRVLPLKLLVKIEITEKQNF